MTHTILLIGGHGKVSQLLTPLLLARSWNVTSMIRTAEQKSAIEKLGDGKPGKLSVLVESVEEVKSESDARKVLEKVEGVDWVVWCAGAGGRGGPQRTRAIDHDAAIHFTRASIHTPQIKKFLNVSYICSRRSRAPWWSDEDWTAAQKVNTEILPAYFAAKVGADEVLAVLAKERVEKEKKEGISEGERFCGVSLRPGTLTDAPKGGVRMGRVEARGETRRATVAETIVRVLETEGARGWLDVLDGENEVGEEVRRVVSEGVDAVEGEDWEGMVERVRKEV
ncbi:hypothetical protein M011DRAFT_465252 [Sporormia fimetaria CBS 119925]|uniref:NAD(P)-binding domain-containing protein n=1 Tax=Sporormia fimetaria CBS 119925 TaxID=1340428 RepID=A0A6A6VK62_9PLEO|nr:hypothetical protein M011DRAFT_465252 [Sporormia fimetaria CBS 119925]